MRNRIGIGLGLVLVVAGVAKVQADDAAKLEKAKKLMKAGQIDGSLDGVVKAAVAALRAEATDPAAYEKWASGVKSEECVAAIAEVFASQLDGATMDAAIAFYESQPGKEFLKAQELVVKSRRLALVTQRETMLRTPLGPRDESVQRMERDGPVLELIGMSAATYAKFLTPENVDAALAFYESPAGSLYQAKLLKISDESRKALQAWLDRKVAVADGPFGKVLRQKNEYTAIGALKTINTAQAIFREGDKEDDGNLDYGSLEELGKTQLIDEKLASGTKSGYSFTVLPSPTTSEFLWYATASPAKPGETGERYFFTNQAGVIFQSMEPFKVNKETCEVPKGLVPIGR
jgi:hypothetical protein